MPAERAPERAAAHLGLALVLGASVAWLALRPPRAALDGAPVRVDEGAPGLWLRADAPPDVPAQVGLAFGIPLDLNTASAEDLEAVPGLGPSRAGAIVADRAARGPFGAVQELDRVRGFGPATVQRLAPFVTVRGATSPR